METADPSDDVTEQIATRDRAHPTPCVSAASTTQGQRRSNEDSWGTNHHRFVVADGVAHGLGGDFASAQAVAGFLSIRIDSDGWETALRRLDRLVALRATAHGLPRAATTIVGVEVAQGSVTVAHAGDSRAYLMRADQLQCLTADHSLATLRREQGRDPEDLADGLGKPRALTGYLGTEVPLKAGSESSFTAMPGDRLLLCTDGVHEQLSFAEIQDHMRLAHRQAVVDSLTAAADAAGGRDNSTALLIEIGA